MHLGSDHMEAEHKTHKWEVHMRRHQKTIVRIIALTLVALMVLGVLGSLLRF